MMPVDVQSCSEEKQKIPDDVMRRLQQQLEETQLSLQISSKTKQKPSNRLKYIQDMDQAQAKCISPPKSPTFVPVRRPSFNSRQLSVPKLSVKPSSMPNPNWPRLSSRKMSNGSLGGSDPGNLDKMPIPEIVLPPRFVEKEQNVGLTKSATVPDLCTFDCDGKPDQNNLDVFGFQRKTPLIRRYSADSGCETSHSDKDFCQKDSQQRDIVFYQENFPKIPFGPRRSSDSGIPSSLAKKKSTNFLNEPSFWSEHKSTSFPDMTSAQPLNYEGLTRNRGWQSDRSLLKPKMDTEKSSFNLSCSMCNGYLKWPHLLDCLHTFCFDCILSNKSNGYITCPTCTNVHKTKGRNHLGVTLDFQFCLFLLDKAVNPFTCTINQCKKSAKMFCDICLKYICADCLMEHETRPDLSSHSISKITSVYKTRDKWIQGCINHPEEQENKFCEDCSTLICPSCLSSKEQHTKHRIIDIQLHSSKIANDLKIKTQKLIKLQENIRNKMQYLNSKKQTFENEARMAVRAIHNFCNDTVSIVDHYKQNARQTTDKLYDAIELKTESKENELCTFLDSFKTFQEFCRRYIEEGDSQHVLAMQSTISNSFKRLIEIHERFQSSNNYQNCEVTFCPDYRMFNEFMNQAFADINNTIVISKEPQVEKSIVRNKLHYNFTEEPSSGECSSDKGFESSSDPNDYNYHRSTIAAFEYFGKFGKGIYEFSEPTGILYLMDGGFAVCDSKNHRVLVYDERRRHQITIGQPPDIATEDPIDSQKTISRRHGFLFFPYRMAQCPTTRNLVIIERPPSRDIQIFTLENEFIVRFGAGIVHFPRAVAVDEDRQIIVAEGRSMIILIFSKNYKLINKHHLSGYLQFPTDLAVKKGIIYVCDNRSNCVLRFDYNGSCLGRIGNESVTYYPIGVSINCVNQLVVTDNHNTFNISVFDLNGQYLFGFKSQVKHDNCYNVSTHPNRMELAVSVKNFQVIFFNFEYYKCFTRNETVG